MKDYRSLNAPPPNPSKRLLNAMLEKHVNRNVRLKKPKEVKHPKFAAARRILNDSGKLACVALRFNSITEFNAPK